MLETDFAPEVEPIGDLLDAKPKVTHDTALVMFLLPREGAPLWPLTSVLLP